MRKRLVLAVPVVVAALLSYMIWIAATSYIRAPMIVAERDRLAANRCFDLSKCAA